MEPQLLDFQFTWLVSCTLTILSCSPRVSSAFLSALLGCREAPESTVGDGQAVGVGAHSCVPGSPGDRGGQGAGLEQRAVATELGSTSLRTGMEEKVVTYRPRVRAHSPGQRPTSALPAAGGLPQPCLHSPRVSVPGQKAVFAFLPSFPPSLPPSCLPSFLPACLPLGSTGHIPVPGTVGGPAKTNKPPCPSFNRADIHSLLPWASRGQDPLPQLWDLPLGAQGCTLVPTH